MTPREFAADVVRRLRDAGHEALWAGGCVRDQLLGHDPHDYDVATSARPDDVRRLFRRTVAVGVSFGVVEVLGPKPLAVQVATFRSDGTYTDGRHPDAVTFGDARADARRRDFTVNGMFFDPIGERLIDYVNGEADLRAGVLRAIGDPVERFTEDKLRVLRAVRFAARFGFAVEPATMAAARAMAGQLTAVSAERIAEETRKLLGHANRLAGFDLLESAGMLPFVLPEAAAERRPVLAALPAWATFELAVAAVIGSADRGEVGRMATRLRLANAERERIAWLGAHRTAMIEAVPRASVLKPLLAHAGAAEVLALNRAGAVAAGRDLTAVEACERCWREWPAEVVNPPPVLTGDDLLQLGLPPGPMFRELLDAVRVEQLEGRVTDRDAAIAFVTGRAAGVDPLT